MKNILIILSLILLTSCGCRWASRNCPAEIIRETDTLIVTEIHDTTFFDTIIQPLPDRIIRLKALAMIDEMGYIQMPETTVTDHYGNSISVRIVHDTVYAESLNRDSLITVLKSNIRKELRSENTKFIQVKTEKNKKTISVFWRIIVVLILAVIILSLVYVIIKKFP
ncbi:MAG: hypothetical protein PF448_13140 [Bacteroidales bacterium]|jgi:hypothetical protein|nr:hypothetical protein [Bacteroidales bacterium]